MTCVFFFPPIVSVEGTVFTVMVSWIREKKNKIKHISLNNCDGDK